MHMDFAGVEILITLRITYGTRFSNAQFNQVMIEALRQIIDEYAEMLANKIWILPTR